MRWTREQLLNHPKRDSLLGKAPVSASPASAPGTPKKGKAAWVTIGGKRFFARSKWEIYYAVWLDTLKKSGLISDWEYEPKTFWFDAIKRGTRSYKPDFSVTQPDGSVEYHEVKGWMDARSKTKIKRMAKYHPTVKLIVRDEGWFYANTSVKSRFALQGVLYG